MGIVVQAPTLRGKGKRWGSIWKGESVETRVCDTWGKSDYT